MDSLQPSLSQALPLRGYDAEQVLQAPFRAAALGIATFYKRAAENGRKAYSMGYAAALQDVLEYLQAGLDHGTDLPRPQGSEQRMALTIERVMDYIERRQDALRAESADSGEEEAGNNQPNTNSQPTQSTSSAASGSSSVASSVTVHNTQPKHQTQPSPPVSESTPQTNSSARKPASQTVSTSASTLAPQPGGSTRRTSPRRTAPPRPTPTPVTHSTTSLSPTLPSASQPVLPPLPLPPTIDYNFTPTAPLPPQFHLHHHSHPHITTPTSLSLGTRRIRGSGTTVEGRKGKAKERSERDKPVVGNNTSSINNSIVNIDIENRKRRFPIELSTVGSPTTNTSTKEEEEVGLDEVVMMDVETRPSKRLATRRLH
ncbi:hypothetical protein CROQUDRAFT_655981 [Cronartium quercuum f. sp. fusiforme G11]|uniref:Uncharacterized protein n=1 Tax=Cronartium quercuum f. sp. fusiforme G11 TaxID=708437 RepID=A0A9P6TDD8_9BASI|nr:hypothetical protein CROQUDRAFT_655981 [Cronartium quercuum f. sp. fusiforme G11]